jgi:hypothetical protein
VPLNFAAARTKHMRTILFLVVGFLLLAACLLLGRLFSTNYPNALYAATIALVSTWLVISVPLRATAQLRR